MSRLTGTHEGQVRKRERKPFDAAEEGQDFGCALVSVVMTSAMGVFLPIGDDTGFGGKSV